MATRQRAQYSHYTWAQLLKSNVQVDEIIGRRILVKGTKLLLVGPPKVRKTTLIAQLMYEIANGLPALGAIDVKQPRSVLVFSFEDSEETLAERSQRLQTAYPLTNIGPDYITAPMMPLTTRDGLAMAQACIAKVRPDIVVYDPLYKVNVEGENDSVTLQRTFNVMDGLAYDYKHTIGLVHHTGKPSFDSLGRVIDKGFGAARGSGALLAWPDSIVLMYERNKGLYLDFMLRHGPGFGGVQLETTDSGIFLAKMPTDTGLNRITAVQKLLSAGPLQTSEIAQRLGVTEQYIRELIAPLIDARKIQRVVDRKDKRIVRYGLEGINGAKEERPVAVRLVRPRP